MSDPAIPAGELDPLFAKIRADLQQTFAQAENVEGARRRGRQAEENKSNWW